MRNKLSQVVHLSGADINFLLRYCILSNVV